VFLSPVLVYFPALYALSSWLCLLDVPGRFVSRTIMFSSSEEGMAAGLAGLGNFRIPAKGNLEG